MGAISAVRTPEGEPPPTVVAKMIAAAPHRGEPAGSLSWGRCHLGIARRPGDDDASLHRGRRMAAIVSGRLDNNSGLGRMLGLEDPSAADVLVEGCDRWGIDQIAVRMRGSYNAVVSDGHSLWAFRDHVGQRPMFYAERGGSYYVATEAKQVAAGAELPAAPDLGILERLFYVDLSTEIPSAVRGVMRVPAGALLHMAHRVTADRYWHPEEVLEGERMSDEELVERFRDLMTTAVIRMSSGRDALALSGGVDSPAVAAFGAPEHMRVFGSPLAAVSGVYPDTPSADESTYIKLVSHHLDMPLHTYEPRAVHLADLDRWVKLLDGPSPVASVSESEEMYLHASQEGYDTVLTGELAESLFDERRFLLSHLVLHRRWSSVADRLRRMKRSGVPVRSILRQLGGSVLPGALAGRVVKRDWTWAPAWIDANRLPEDDSAGLAPYKRWSHEQLVPLLRPDLASEAQEICAAVCGVELRRPWSDVDMWEFFLSIPAEVKFRHLRRKELIRGFVRGALPHDVVFRSDKTNLAEAFMKSVDYSILKRWLYDSDYRMPGVDYPTLRARLEREDLDLISIRWAGRLAAVHAFVETS
jgi:asparagine synthase (glutamine-hydrolysing)